MYKEYYGFSSYPFDKNINFDQFYNSKNFCEFQNRMTFLQKHKGIGVFWGTPGSGKSAALRWLSNSLNKNRFKFYYLPDPPSSISDFYRQLAIVMDIKPAFKRIDNYFLIQNFINDLRNHKKIIPIIALDECQMYSHTVIESLRLFLNFDIDSRHNVILIIVGQPELKKRLKYAVYEPFTQRVTVSFQFTGLEQDEVEHYLSHRLKIAGVNHQLFEQESIQFIYQVTKGVLRKIDSVAIKSLFAAAGLKKKSVDQSVVESVVSENLWA
jgi:type II secretory pathway predicted ATPase ExeA